MPAPTFYKVFQANRRGADIPVWIHDLPRRLKRLRFPSTWPKLKLLNCYLFFRLLILISIFLHINSFWNLYFFENLSIIAVTYPQWRPITSIINVLWWEYAVLTMASILSMILWRAESVPIVMSVPQKSLSMEPTNPTMWRCSNFSDCSCVMSPVRKLQFFSWKRMWFKTKKIDKISKKKNFFF